MSHVHDPLPNEEQRRALCEMIRDAFVEARLLGWRGRAEQVADLADAFHHVSMDLHHAGIWNVGAFRAMLEDYQRRWHADPCSPRFDYVAMLDRIFPPSDEDRAAPA